MMRVEGENVTEIDRRAESVSVPSLARKIGKFSCFSGSLSVLNIENTNIVVIGKYAFSQCYELTEVIFPSSLEKIQKASFSYCKNLNSIKFRQPSKLHKIGAKAFAYCIKLKSFEFPPNIETVECGAFKNCKQLKELDFTRTKVRCLGFNILGYQNKYCSIFLSPTVTVKSIIDNCDYNIEISEDHPFAQRSTPSGYYFTCGSIIQGNKNSRHVLIRRGVERIETNCFCCSNLVSVTIPASVKIISSFAFYQSKSLQKIHFSQNSCLKKIKYGAFFGCTSLKKVIFPKSLKNLDYHSFSCCTLLENVVFPRDSKLEKVDSAFPNTLIKHLSLPPSIEKIGDILYEMDHLESVFVNNDFYKTTKEGNAIFSRDGKQLINVIKTIESFDIPNNVEVIKKYTFYGSKISGRLVIPKSVEVIEEKAFTFCENLQIIEFEQGSRLKSLGFESLCDLEDLIIDNENFTKLENGIVMSQNPRGIVFAPGHLTSFDVPPDIEVIFSYAFSKLKISSYKLPKSLKKIGDYAFPSSFINSTEFEEGTALEYIGNLLYYLAYFGNLKIPIHDGVNIYVRKNHIKLIEFPPHYKLYRRDTINSYYSHLYSSSFGFGYGRRTKVVCPKSSIPTVAQIDFDEYTVIMFEIIDDQ